MYNKVVEPTMDTIIVLTTGKVIELTKEELHQLKSLLGVNFFPNVTPNTWPMYPVEGPGWTSHVTVGNTPTPTVTIIQ